MTAQRWPKGYVFQDRKGFWWACSCGALSKTFFKKKDAATDAWVRHKERSRA